jgi:hypothetical protein
VTVRLEPLPTTMDEGCAEEGAGVREEMLLGWGGVGRAEVDIRKGAGEGLLVPVLGPQGTGRRLL